MKKYILLAGMLLGIISTVDAAPQFVKFDKASAENALLLTGTKDTIRYSPSDWKGVKMAVANLRHDLRSVTGSEYAPVVVATVGKSEMGAISHLHRQGTTGDSRLRQAWYHLWYL